MTQVAKACLRLLDEQKLRNNLSENSRKIAAEKYRWEPLFERMNEELQQIIRNKH